VEPWQLGSRHLTRVGTARPGRPASAADGRVPSLPCSLLSFTRFLFFPATTSQFRRFRPRGAGGRAGRGAAPARAEEGTGRGGPRRDTGTRQDGTEPQRSSGGRCAHVWCLLLPAFALPMVLFLLMGAGRGSRQRPTGHVGTTPGRCRRRPSPSPVTCKQAPQPLSNESRDH